MFHLFKKKGEPSGAPAFDPALNDILNELKKSVTLEAEGLGTFTLNRSVDWFQAEVDWQGQSVQLTLDRGEAQQLAAAQDTARALVAGQAQWDADIRAYAAEQLLSLKNESWAEEGEQISQADFISSMVLEAIQILDGRTFDFWFNDGQLFWGHSIRVEGDLDHGPTRAGIEG